MVIQGGERVRRKGGTVGLDTDKKPVRSHKVPDYLPTVPRLRASSLTEMLIEPQRLRWPPVLFIPSRVNLVWSVIR